MHKPFVSFVIPTMNRPSLRATLVSLVNQTDGDFEVIIVTDHCDISPAVLKHIGRKVIAVLPFSRGGEKFDPMFYRCGLMRNEGYERAEGEWIGTVDDDDTLASNYVECLRSVPDDVDMVLFTAKFPDGSTRPPAGETKLSPYNVTNAFAVRKEFVRNHNIKYILGTSTDWPFIQDCLKAGAKVDICPLALYFIKH